MPLPLSFVVKKGSKTRSLHLVGHAGAGVADRDRDMVAALLARSAVAGAEVRHHDRKAAPVRHGVAGVDGEIDERRLELRRVDLDEPEPVLGLEIDLDALAERALQELDHPGHEVLQVDDAGLKRLPAREGEEAVGEIGAALRALDREAHAPSGLLVAVERGAAGDRGCR